MLQCGNVRMIGQLLIMHRDESIARYILTNQSKFYNRSNDEINRLFLNKLSKYHKTIRQETIWTNQDTYSYATEL